MTTLETGFTFIKVESDGSVARLVLNRPPLNVLDLETIRELNRALRDLRADDALRVLVISAEGKAFSAGVSVQDHLPERVELMLGAFHEVFRQLRRLGCPTLAVVEGAALGGGCELACFADFVIASESASFGVPEIKLGAFPPIAAIHFPERIGLARTLRLVLTGDILPAVEAARIGLVDHLAPDDGVAEAVDTLVKRLKEKSASSLRLAKRAVLGATARDFDARLAEAEKVFLQELMKTPDAPEGLRAFLEKRPPRWSHR